jgi:hypothetical protein
MLQPVMMAPSPASSAAPTLKCENAASAFSRARRDAAFADTAVALGAAGVLHPAIEAGAAIRFDPGTAIVEHQVHGGALVHAVDDVGHPRDAEQARRQRLDFGIGVAALGRRRIVPVADGVEPARMPFVTNHLGAPVFLANQQRFQMRGDRVELLDVPVRDVHERHRQPAGVRAVQ